MAVTGISFFYDEEKVNILKKAAASDDRTTSSYLQIILQKHIDKVVGGDSLPVGKKRKKVIRRKRG